MDDKPWHKRALELEMDLLKLRYDSLAKELEAIANGEADILVKIKNKLLQGDPRNAILDFINDVLNSTA